MIYRNVEIKGHDKALDQETAPQNHDSETEASEDHMPTLISEFQPGQDS